MAQSKRKPTNTTDPLLAEIEAFRAKMKARGKCPTCGKKHAKDGLPSCECCPSCGATEDSDYGCEDCMALS